MSTRKDITFSDKKNEKTFTPAMLIRSQDRSSGTSSKFPIDFGGHYLNKGKIKFSKFKIPATNYNVNKTNNTVYFVIGDEKKLFTVNIPEGHYTKSDLPSELKKIMLRRASELMEDDWLKVEYINNTDKLRFTSSNLPFGFSFKTNTENSARFLLGFNEEDTPLDSTVNSPNVINLSYHTHISVRTNNSAISIPKMCRLAKKGSSAQYPIILYYDKKTKSYVSYDDICYETDHPLGNLDISIVDFDGNLIDLNGGDWEFLIWNQNE